MIKINNLSIPNPAPNNYIIGIDEVARGCFAGPVIATAICLNCPAIIAEINAPIHHIPLICDSKKINHEKRAAAESWIKTHAALSIGYGAASPAEIDALNIRVATFTAMTRALKQCLASLPPNPESITIYIDGNAFEFPESEYEPYLTAPHMHYYTIVKGDASNFAIACASILAKEYRDRELDNLVIANPELVKYNWEKNRAYGTAEHIAHIRKYGITQWHRKSFLTKLGLEQSAVV